MSTITGSSRTHRGDVMEGGDDAGSIFGGVVLITAGLFQFFEGLSAVAKDDVYVRTANYLYDFDLTGWGWFHIVVGVVVVGVGVAVLMGREWAMVLGIVMASVAALMQFMFLPWQPLWALAIIGINIAVIWALAVRLRSV